MGARRPRGSASKALLLALALAAGIPAVAPARSVSGLSGGQPAVAAVAVTVQDEYGEEEAPLVDANTAARWGWYLSLFVLIGATAFPAVARSGLRRFDLDDRDTLDRIARSARRLGLLAAAALLAVTLFRLYAQVRSFLDPTEPFTIAAARQMVGESTWGSGWRVQLGVAVAALVGLLLAGRRPGLGWTAAGVAALVAAATEPLTGHAVGGPWPPVLAVPLQGLHVLAGGLWLGTLFAMLVVGYGAARPLPRGRRAMALAGFVNAFSPLALVCAGTVIVLGAVMTYEYVGSIPELFASTYGRALLVKVGLLLGVMAFGAWNWRRVRPSLGDPTRGSALRRSATIELLIGVALLAVTAVLAALPAPRL